MKGTPTPPKAKSATHHYLLDVDDPQSCVPLLIDALAEAERVGERYWAELITFGLIDVFIPTGDLAAARTLIEQSESNIKNAEFSEMLQADKLQVLALASGEVRAAGKVADLLPQLFASADPEGRHLANRTEGWLHLLAGNPVLAFDVTWDSLAGIPLTELPRLLDLPTHAAAWTGDLGTVERARELARRGARPGRVFAAFVGSLDAIAALLSGTDSGAALAASARVFSEMNLRLHASMTWAELALLTAEIELAKDADRRAREGFAEMGAEGLLKLYEQSLVGRRP